MTLNVSGAQGVVSGTLTVNSGQSTGEILVFTTASTADYTALVTLSLVAVFPGGGSGITGGFVLPGAGAGAATDGSVQVSYSGGGVAITRPTSGLSSWAATATVRVGPGTAVKVPWAWSNASTYAATLNYIINYHVASVRNP